MRSTAVLLGLVLLVSGCGSDADEDDGRLTFEEAEPFEPRAEVDPARLRYGEVQVESMNVENRITILVAASNVEGVQRSQLAPERLVVRVAYDDSLTDPAAIAAAISRAGYPAGVLRHSMPIPDDFTEP
ncbi:MAG: hypothetical protein H6719_06865 [Sandaracinaceae bacterium]|nr:hypothetical protein [Sandaracinaceae bacterium]